MIVADQLYPLQVACELIPVKTTAALYQFLFRHKDEFPQRYSQAKGRPPRMLYGHEILRIREMRINEYVGRRFYEGNGRPSNKRARSVIDYIIAQATS